MEEKICQIHQDEMVSVCFFEGCTNYFLCSKCIKCHPDDHELSIKSIMSLLRKDDWIRLNEEQRDLEIAQMKDAYQVKDLLLSENKKKLQEKVDEIIDCLRKRLSQWTLELENLDTNHSFAKLEDTLCILGNINFREGDIYDKVDKSKQLNENILPDSKEVCKQVQSAIDRFKIDQSKLDSYKKDIIELLESIHLKDLFALSKSKRQNTYEQLNLTQQEYASFKEDMAKKMDKLNQNIEQLEKSNNDLQAQLNQLSESNNDCKQKIETLTLTNEEIQDEASMFKDELDSVVASKLKLHNDYKTLLEKYTTVGLCNEESLIIQAKDVHNLRSWIQNPIKSDKPNNFHLDLLYRATRDGFLRSTFFSKCNDKSPTIAFIKSKEHGRVFGGYTTKKWDSKGKYIEDEEAFLFSLTYGEKYPVEYHENAVYIGFNCILAFGDGCDIYIPEGCNTESNKAHTNFPHTYECSKFANCDIPGAKEYLAGSWEFVVEEIEVYQVIW